MRLIHFVLPALATMAMFVPAAGHAETYKWCAYYGGRGGEASNCGFSTLEQCRATVSGIGGYCGVNPFYGEPQRQPKRSHR